jgi:DNA-binding beta-propeller fold protein YncE
LDNYDQTITEYDPSGAQVVQWSPGTLSAPSDIALDSQGSIYVVDQYADDPIQKFEPDGTRLVFGPGASAISYPLGIYIDNNDIIYVTDQGGAYGSRVLCFDLSGNQIRTFGEIQDLEGLQYRDIVVDESNQEIYIITGSLVAKFNMNGDFVESWSGQFYSPNSIAIGGNGDILIADTYNNQVDQYDSDGNLRSSFADDCYRPYHIVTDSTGKLFVADWGNMQIKIYE